jgi:hypothetical protein
MDGSCAGSRPEIDVLTDDVSVRLLSRHFEAWGLTDHERARAAAGRVLRTWQRLARDGIAADPLELATDWIRAMAGARDDWFFRARSLLGRFPGAFLETDPPARREPVELELLPRPAPLAMPEQDIAGPVARALRVARSALEEALPALGSEPFPR